MSNRLWAVMLAGGGGVRLKSLAQRIRGDDRPKQYVPVLGDRPAWLLPSDLAVS